MEQSMINCIDIFKADFIERMKPVSGWDMVLTLALAFALGLLINQVYKRTFQGLMYSAKLGLSLMILTSISTLINLVTTLHVVLLLCVFGAISLMYFRNAIKEPLEIAFLLWSVGVGVLIGEGLVAPGVFGSIFIGIIMIVIVDKKLIKDIYVVDISCEDEFSDMEVIYMVAKKVNRYKVRSKTALATSGVELSVEVKIKDDTNSFVNELSNIKGVSNVVLTSYND